MSYHIKGTRFKELPDKIIVREDGYMSAWKQESVPIVDYVYVRQDAGTRWHELFGSPEKAARTVCDISSHELYECDGCPLDPICTEESTRPTPNDGGYGALLEWLRGKAVG